MNPDSDKVIVYIHACKDGYPASAPGDIVFPVNSSRGCVASKIADYVRSGMLRPGMYVARWPYNYSTVKLELIFTVVAETEPRYRVEVTP